MSESTLPAQTITSAGNFFQVGKVFRPRELRRCAECGALRGTLVGSSFADPGAETTVTLTCGCGWLGFAGSSEREVDLD